MTENTSRRTFMALACASAALLAACGSGTIESALVPDRFFSVGDGFSDLGQTDGLRYTVNDASANIWTEVVVTNYKKELERSARGGRSYAKVGARVAGAAPSIQTQIDTLLTDDTLAANDVVLVNGGLSDIVAEVTAHGISDLTTANVKAAGTALGAQVRRLVTAGARQVVVAGSYNLGLSPWAVALGQVGPLTELTNRFNEAFLISVVDLGANVLYVDAALYINLVQASPTGYNLVNVKDVACTTPDASTCSMSTIVSGIDYTKALFADTLYLTPVANRLFGNYAYTKLRERW